MKGSPLPISCALLILLSACGESQISRKLSAVSSDKTNSESAAPELGNAYMNLWVSPARNANGSTNSLTSTSLATSATVNAIPRVNTPLYLLQDTAGLKSSLLQVRNDTVTNSSGAYTTAATLYSSYPNKSVAWTHRDFQNFMGFASFSAAIKKAVDLFPAQSITSQRNIAGSNIFPLKVFVNECCNALSTGYDPSARDVVFYRHSDSSSVPYYRYNMIDEVELAAHEFGHVLQHSLNKTVLEISAGVNPSIDLILEALSDFYSAAAVNNEFIFTYTENNVSGIISNQGGLRYTPDKKYRRNIGSSNTLNLADNYVAESHMDGRVLAAALNDIRKSFVNQGISICDKGTGVCLGLSSQQAFDEVTKLSHLAYARMSTSTSLQGYAQLIIDQWTDVSYRSTCALISTSTTENACKTAGRNIVINALTARGIYRPVSNIPAAASVVSLPTTLTYLNFTEGTRNDGDSILESCETIMVYPNVGNISTNVDLAFGWAKLNSISGFTVVSTIEAVSSEIKKVIPWLKAGDTTPNLIGSKTALSSSRLFQKVFESSFLTPFTNNVANAATEIGWILRAPASGSASVNFKTDLYTYNSNSSSGFRASSVSQSINVTSTRSSCD